jgi:glycosyltransferase involved in cell wall biosynthesis
MITQMCVTEGNKALHENRYGDALKYYSIAIQANQLLQQNLQYNLDLATNRIASRISTKKLEKYNDLDANVKKSDLDELGADNDAFSDSSARLFLVSMVRNEIEVINEWLSHVLSLFDEVHIVDHISTDGTRERLTDLALAYPNLKLYVCDEPAYRQKEIMTHITTHELNADANDWVFFVDADEFLPFQNKKAFSEAMSAYRTQRVIRLPWLNLVPQDFDTKKYFYREYLRPRTTSVVGKIAFRPKLFKDGDFYLEQGNHALVVNGSRQDAKDAFELLHIPVRSFTQLSKKIHDGVAAYQLMSESGTTVGFHWFEIAKYINANKIGQDELNGIIYRYSENDKTIRSINKATLYSNGYTNYFLNISTLSPVSVSEHIFKSLVSEGMDSVEKSQAITQLVIDRVGSVTTRILSTKLQTQLQSKSKLQSNSNAELPKRSFSCRVLGKEYFFPEKSDSKRDVDIAIDTFKKHLLTFLGSRSFPHGTYALDYLDASPVHTLFVADLLKNIKVIRFCRDQDEVAYIKNLCQLNSIENIVALDPVSASLKLFDKTRDLFDQLVFKDTNDINVKNVDMKPVLLLGSATRAVIDNQIKDLIDQSTLGWSLFYVEDSQPQLTWQATEQTDISCFSESTNFARSNFATGAYAIKEPGLDIVVAMYNTPLYIIECVDSLISKGRDDINVIIVNDGSTDNSLSIVNAHYLTNPRVKIITKVNGGCASARNFGRLHSEKTHITFIDSDDFCDLDMFAQLYDLSVYTGAEVTQGGFDFYDQDATEKITPSYEDALFATYPADQFYGQRVIRIQAADLIPGQPTIWRRVYRRDFLDSKNIFFPENVRAYDDYIFHSLTIYYARDVFMMPDLKLHYRQHAGQDIKQGDERHFFEIYMFKQLLRRSLSEGWADFSIFIPSMMNTVSWSLQTLRQDLTKPFALASAKFFWCVEKVYGSEVTEAHNLLAIANESFQAELSRLREAGKGLYTSYVWAYIESIENSPITLSMLNAVRSPTVEDKQ